jgi:carbamoyltransferase
VNSRVSWPKRSIGSRVARRKSVKDFLTVAKYFIKMRLKRFARPIIYRALRRFYSAEMFSEPAALPPIRLPRPARTKEDKLPDRYYSSVAYAVQKILEMVACRLGAKLRSITGSENLCVAGGVGLNIDANSKFITDVGFKRIFIQPGASDAGIPLGAALWGCHMILGMPRFYEMKSASLGRSYGGREIEDAIEAEKDRIEVRKSKDVAKETARFLADGKIVGWFYGGSEYGPRALGNRSILCDARGPSMKDTVNNRVKHREPWRPFAASVLKEDAPEWFNLPDDSPFMLLVADVRADKRPLIPAVVHVDGTCRIQTVTKTENGRYYDLLSEFRKLTGTPLILDTSFNLSGEPIVETPADALTSFLATDMDYLVLEEYIITKK